MMTFSFMPSLGLENHSDATAKHLKWVQMFSPLIMTDLTILYRLAQFFNLTVYHKYSNLYKISRASSSRPTGYSNYRVYNLFLINLNYIWINKWQDLLVTEICKKNYFHNHKKISHKTGTSIASY